MECHTRLPAELMGRTIAKQMNHASMRDSMEIAQITFEWLNIPLLEVLLVKIHFKGYRQLLPLAGSQVRCKTSCHVVFMSMCSVLA